MTDELPMVKIAFRDDEGDVETLWAFDLGEGRYKLDNTPWFQYGISTQDIVSASPEQDGMLFFVSILAKSGYRTLRVQSEEHIDPSFLEQLIAAGCSYEGANPKFIAIDVPPAVELSVPVGLLSNSGLLWEYADPTYEQIHGTVA